MRKNADISATQTYVSKNIFLADINNEGEACAYCERMTRSFDDNLSAGQEPNVQGEPNQPQPVGAHPVRFPFFSALHYSSLFL